MAYRRQDSFTETNGAFGIDERDVRRQRVEHDRHGRPRNPISGDRHGSRSRQGRLASTMARTGRFFLRAGAPA